MKKILLITVALAFLAGCSTRATRGIRTEGLEGYGQYGGDDRTRGSRLSLNMADQDTERQKIIERKVISSADIRLETSQPDTVHNKVIDLAGKYQGYVLLSEDYKTTIRIPSLHFVDAITEIETLGEVVSKKLSGKDITENYNDLEVRLDNAEKTRQRYLALLERANSVTEMLKIEAELVRINTNIEILKGKLRRMSHLVEYATISVNTDNQVRPGPLGYVFVGLHKGIKWLFVWD